MILEGKTLIVTGVGTGLGSEIARVGLRDGANLVLAARTRENLEAAAKALDPSGARVEIVTADITDPAQCDAWETLRRKPEDYKRRVREQVKLCPQP